MIYHHKRNLQIKEFSSNYLLRTWTTGCYFYEKHRKEWMATGMSVRITEVFNEFFIIILLLVQL